jgi:hypothetical protein
VAPGPGPRRPVVFEDGHAGVQTSPSQDLLEGAKRLGTVEGGQRHRILSQCLGEFEGTMQLGAKAAPGGFHDRLALLVPVALDAVEAVLHDQEQQRRKDK